MHNRPRRSGRFLYEPLEHRLAFSADAVEVSGFEHDAAYLIDDGSPGYLEVGENWRTAWGTAGFWQDSRQRNAGNGDSYAQWSVQGLTPGTYEVFATWVPSLLYRATNAEYQVFDGVQLDGTRVVDQRFASTDLLLESRWWKSLGNYEISSGSISVRLNNQADSQISADAVAIVRHNPIAVDDAFVVSVGESVAMNVLGNDVPPPGTSLTVTVQTQPQHGRLEQDGDQFRYFAGEEFIGTDSFTYRITDSSGGWTDARVTVDVTSFEKREPRFLWTPEWQANYERARSENHPWWQLIKSNADRTGTKSERYNDYGQWAALVYRITGDVAYGRKALEKHLPLVAAVGANHVREHYVEDVILYDWLLPVMSAAERVEYQERLHSLARYTLGIGQPDYQGGFRTFDSDQTVGQYFGLALTDLALGSDYLKQFSVAPHLPKLPVGGLTATAKDDSSVRNSIARYFEAAKGGQWIESSSYNLGTNKLLLLGIESIRTATGKDYFPEATEYFAQLKQSLLADLTPDLKDSYQWGDEEHPHDLRLSSRAPLMVALGLNGVVDERNIWSRAFYTGNPYAEPVKVPKVMVHEASGVGTMVVKDETKLFASHMANLLGVDHTVEYLNDFVMWANGEWVVDRPRGYARNSGNHVNGMLLAGLSSSGTTRTLVSSGSNEAEGFYFQVGTTGGPHYAGKYYDPPPEFLHGWTRSVVYLPEYPAIVVYDTIDMEDPQALAKYDRYHQRDRLLIEAAPALKQWFLHVPEVPTIEGNRATWQTAGGQSITLRTLSPGEYQTDVIDETTDPAFGGDGFKASELRHHLRLSSDTATTFVNVISLGIEPDSRLLNNNTVSVGRHTLKFNGETVESQNGATIVGRHVFYNNSRFDGSDLMPNSLDDAALAIDKRALLPGQDATFANYTSYGRGINGVFIDVNGLAGVPTSADFNFTVGNSSDPSQWHLLNIKPTITVRPGAGLDGATRIALTWPDNVIRNQWLQVTVKATPETGLVADDVFYFGNAVGESGNSTFDARVTVSDEVTVRNLLNAGLGGPASISNPLDFNRDGSVTISDLIYARNNRTSVETGLRLIVAPPPTAMQYTPGLAPQALLDVIGEEWTSESSVELPSVEALAAEKDPRSIVFAELDQYDTIQQPNGWYNGHYRRAGRAKPVSVNGLVGSPLLNLYSS